MTSVADVLARSALRASSSDDLVVPRTRRRIESTTRLSLSPHGEHAGTAEATLADLGFFRGVTLGTRASEASEH